MIVDEPFNPNKYPLRDYAGFSIEVPIHGDKYSIRCKFSRMHEDVLNIIDANMIRFTFQDYWEFNEFVDMLNQMKKSLDEKARYGKEVSSVNKIDFDKGE